MILGAAVVAGAVYISLRLAWLFRLETPYRFPDSPGYTEGNWRSPGRPPIGAWLFHLFGASTTALVVFALISVAAFAALGTVLSLTYRWSWPLVAAITVYSLGSFVAGWDAYILVEGLCLSGVVFLVAAAVSLGSNRIGWGWRTALLTVGIALTVGTKESAVLLALPALVAFCACAWPHRRRPMRVLQIAGAVVLFASLAVMARQSSSRPLPVWPANSQPAAIQQRITASNIREFNIVYGYVLTDHVMATRWTNEGMPPMPADAISLGGMARRYDDPTVVKWVESHVQRLWAIEVLRNPVAAVGRTREVNANGYTYMRALNRVAKPPAIGRGGDLVVPRSGRAQVVLNAVCLAALFFAGTKQRTYRHVRRQRGAEPKDPVGGWLAAMSLAAAAHLVVVVNSDTADAWRHQQIALVVTPILVGITALHVFWHHGLRRAVRATSPTSADNPWGPSTPR